LKPDIVIHSNDKPVFGTISLDNLNDVETRALALIGKILSKMELPALAAISRTVVTVIGQYPHPAVGNIEMIR